LSAGSENQSGRGAIASASDVQEMFDRIVPRYDLMNHIMTGGLDVRWRKLAVQNVNAIQPERVIDVATGTGDVAVALAHAGIPDVIALDFSAGMIAAARNKVSAEARIALVRGDGMTLPLGESSIDALTISFGLRNMPDYERAIAEFVRVVRPGGRIVILEMSPTSEGRFASVFNWYFRTIMPRIGRLISGDRNAYSYLPDSVAAFPDRDRLMRMMLVAGCSRVTITSLGFGTVTLHVGEKAPAG